jgi:hypothetical protein
MSAENKNMFASQLNPKAPSFETLKRENLTKIIETQNEDIFSLKSIFSEAQMEITKKDGEIQRLKEIIYTNLTFLETNKDISEGEEAVDIKPKIEVKGEKIEPIDEIINGMEIIFRVDLPVKDIITFIDNKEED